MDIKFYKYALIVMGAVVLAAGLGSVWAGEKTEVQEITPVPLFAPDGSAVPGNVSEGKIDGFQKKGVIIGDSYHPFSSSVIFLSAKRTPASKTDFDVSERVGYRLNSKGEIVVMWIEDRTKAP